MHQIPILVPTQMYEFAWKLQMCVPGDKEGTSQRIFVLVKAAVCFKDNNTGFSLQVTGQFYC